jgi:putative ABC transport system permease protein
MSLLALSLAYIRARALGTALNLLLLALGVGTIVLLLLFGAQLGERLTRDARGIDLVIGAKGSPLQLILSAVYHADFPTGNVPLAEAERWASHRLVEQAIPLALGDSLAGFRIVGTEHGYVAHYGASLAAGRLWQAPFEATLGAAVAAATGLEVGDRFVGSHGLAGGGPAHAEHPYSVVGVLAPSASVLDRLVLTPIASVWQVHGLAGADHAHDEVEEVHGHDEGEAAGDEDHAPDEAEGGADPRRAVTALLIRYASPLAAVQLPLEVNRESALQAASPAFETARLLALVGVGIDTLRGFGGLLIVSAGLSVFIALWNAMQERRYDLAVLRLLGAPRRALFAQPLIEGLLLAGGGALLGLVLGHGTAELLGQLLRAGQSLGLSGLVFLRGELYVVLLALAIGALAALLPALQAYRTDIAAVLATR